MSIVRSNAKPVVAGLLMVLVNLFAIAEEGEREKLPPLHHVVDVAVPDGMSVPEAFPLSADGHIVCKTCHGIEGIEELPFDEVDRDAPEFHRGGPYRRLTDFCYRCHDEQAYRRPNIHELLDEQGGYDEKACEYCHRKAPDPKQVEIRPDDLKLRLPSRKLCYGCHLKTPHLNALNHQVEPDEEMRKRIEQAERAHGVILPLDPDGRITCVTCHTPHPRGVIDPERPAGKQVADTDLEEGITYREHPWDAVFREDKRERLARMAEEVGTRYTLTYRRLVKEVLLRLPAKDGTLCLACHEFER